VLGVLLLTPASARADWLVTPFVGARIDAKTVLIDLDQASGTTKPIVGVSVGHLGLGVLGFEADLGYLPGFFDSSSRGGLVSSSRVAALTGQVLVAAPAAVMRDSLRPYLTVGAGVVHVGIADLRNLLDVSENYGALSVGAGAIGRTGRKTSVRLDLRRMQTLTEGSAPIVGTGTTRLSFWRASVGLSLHY
jgi:hypothetical protein